MDFKELFKDVQKAIAVYNSNELDIDEGGANNNIELKDWIKEGRKQLDLTRETLRHLCEPVPPPREVEQFLRYFCGDGADPQGLSDTEPLRISFYKAVAASCAPTWRFPANWPQLATPRPRRRLLRTR